MAVEVQNCCQRLIFTPISTATHPREQLMFIISYDWLVLRMYTEENAYL